MSRERPSRGTVPCTSKGRKEGSARSPRLLSGLWAHVTGTQVLAGKLEESVNGAQPRIAYEWWVRRRDASAKHFPSARAGNAGPERAFRARAAAPPLAGRPVPASCPARLVVARASCASVGAGPTARSMGGCPTLIGGWTAQKIKYPVWEPISVGWRGRCNGAILTGTDEGHACLRAV